MFLIWDSMVQSGLVFAKDRQALVRYVRETVIEDAAADPDRPPPSLQPGSDFRRDLAQIKVCDLSKLEMVDGEYVPEARELDSVWSPISELLEFEEKTTIVVSEHREG